jgi:hypothetical protein
MGGARLRCMPVRHMPPRCMLLRYAYEMRAREVHARDMYAHETSAYETHAPMRFTPMTYPSMGYMPVGYMPIRYVPVRYIPTRYKPIEYILMGCISVRYPSPLRCDELFRTTDSTCSANICHTAYYRASDTRNRASRSSIPLIRRADWRFDQLLETFYC